ncbi:MAG TPA: methyltransferase domain-containing protein [Anaerolineales bacterium]|nr:methyltransferase domain-containing protein [Anaerolineales bacterium]
MKLLRRLHFNFWYFRRPPWDSGISPPELFDFISEHPPGRAIDLGCGTGTNVITLVQYGWQATGIDFAPRAVQIARAKLKKAHVRAELRVGDVTNLNGVVGPFNLALDMGCFHGIERRTAYLAELKRVLASNGYWLMYGIFKAPSSRTGLVTADLELIQAQGFRLLWRKDGVDRRDRSSAWFLFQKS